MKKIYLLIATTALCLVNLSSCKDLDKYPKDSVNSEIYFTTAEQLEQYSNQFYTLFPSAADLYGEISDEITASTLPEEMMGSRVVPVDASGTKWDWTMLRHINYLLEHANQCLDESARKQYSGLAYFFRAYFYFDKVRYYGDVPLIRHTLGSNDKILYSARISRTVVMDSVLYDLNQAIEMLPKQNGSTYRVNAYTAMALKSRVCLFEGTFRKYHGGDNYKEILKQGADAARQLMNSGAYSLFTQEGPHYGAYRNLFCQGKYGGNCEVILARYYGAEVKLTHDANGYTVSSTTGKPGFTKRFVNQFLMADGSRFTDQANYDLIPMGKEMTGRDPRMEQIVFRPTHYYRVGEDEADKYDIKSLSTGYQLIKYVMERGKDTYNHSDCDVPLFRYAEVLLNYAECLAEAGELTQDDINLSIKLLRDRAKMPNLNMADANNKPCPYMESLYPHVEQGGNKGVILEIRRERDIELVQEGFRYWDLMRWKEGQALTQPLLGIGFKGVSKNKTDKSGCVNTKNDNPNTFDVCVWSAADPNDKPFSFKAAFLELNKEVWLTNGMDGGNILCHGTDVRTFNEDRDYLYPIPTQEIILSNGALKQNPGW